MKTRLAQYQWLWLIGTIALAGQVAKASPATMTRDEIIDLAKSGVDYSYWWGHGRWRTDKTQLGSCSGSCPDCTHSGSYGADCSGFAAKVWQVPSPIAVTTDAHPYNTGAFRYNETHWDQIGKDSIKRGDALVYRNSANTAGHIVIYESGDPWGSSWVYEAKGCSYGIRHNVKTISSSYVAIKRHSVQDTPVNGTLQGVVFEDTGSGTEDMSIRVGGAQVALSSGASASSRSDDGFWSFSLPAGTYTVTVSASGFLSSSRSCSVTAGGESWCSVGIESVCIPDCTGRQCGVDPVCGESCGSCSGNDTCQDGTCQCVAQCANRQCGADPVCGESCGSCPAGHECDPEGQCVCVPDCSGRECGPDPVCGANCGACMEGFACNAGGACEPAGCVANCQGLECGPDPVCGESCGLCQPDRACTTTGQCAAIESGKGKIYGYVVKLQGDEEEANLENGRPVGGALISLDGVPQTEADEHGYYELELAPGVYRFSASSEDCRDGEAECTVEEDGFTECFLPVYANQEQDEDEIVVRGGCSVAGKTGGLSLVLLPLLGLLATFRRRKIRPRLASLFMAGLAGLFLVAGCAPGGDTGAMEEGELYNTAGLEGAPLFDAEGVAVPARTDRPFIRVGLLWDAGPGTHLEGRTIDPLGGWSDWRSIEPRWSEEGFHTGHLDVPEGQVAVGFQLRYWGEQPPSSLMAEGIEEVGEARVEQSIDLPPQDGLGSLHQALAPHSLVHTRSDWGARSPACNSGSHSPAKITIHHTATPLPDTVSVITRIRGIQNYHIDSQGWCDIGYHYLVDWNGEIWQGRYETTIGAHVANNNTNNVGISFIGTYNSSSATSAQLNKTAALMAWLHDHYGIPMNRTYVKGHREYRGSSPGDCPGDKIFAKLGNLCTMAANGGDVVTDGSIKGVVFEDKGSGADDMSTRIPGASVQVNGGSSTTAGGDDAYWSFSLPAGSYTITASATGYQSASRSCSVTAGGETWCSIGMVKVTNKGFIKGSVFEDKGSGTDDMSTRIPGATVQVGGGSSTTAGTGDAMWSFSLDAGTYTITASASGYQSVSRSCSVTAGGETWCSIGLFKETVCVPDCGGRQCGSDPVCGENCGQCDAGHTCSPDGECVCNPDCAGRECGPDPVCGASCGNCVEGLVCTQEGTCEQEVVCEPDCTGRECGPDPVCGLSCGICQPAQTCDAGGNCTSIDPSIGKLYGYVIKLQSEEQEANLEHGRPVGDARVWLTTGEIAETDEAGYYELLVPAAEHLVSASAEGCRAGSATCTVETGGFTECFVPVYSEDSSEDPDLDDIVVRGGCATGGSGGIEWVWLIAIGILFLGRTRSRQSRKSKRPL